MHMSNYPLVSVLICAYNSEKFILPTILSAITQRYSNLEILVLNNNSSDSTGIILDKLESTDARLRIYHYENNLGPYEGLNYLIDKAKGKYIAILDHDDIWHPRKIDFQVAFLENNPQFIGCGSLPYIYFEADQTIIYPANYKLNSKIVPHPSLIFLNNNYYYDTDIHYKTDAHFMKYVLCKKSKLSLHLINLPLYISRVRKDKSNLNFNWLTPKNLLSYFVKTKDMRVFIKALFLSFLPYDIKLKLYKATYHKGLIIPKMQFRQIEFNQEFTKF